MSYATADQLRAFIGVKTFDDLYRESSPEFDLNAAAAEIDGYLAPRYAVPVTVPAVLPLLQNLEMALARALAYERNVAGDIPKKVADRAAVVRAMLEAICKGEMLLAGAAVAARQELVAVIESDPPRFTRDQMREF